MRAEHKHASGRGSGIGESAACLFDDFDGEHIETVADPPARLTGARPVKVIEDPSTQSDPQPLSDSKR